MRAVIKRVHRIVRGRPQSYTQRYWVADSTWAAVRSQVKAVLQYHRQIATTYGLVQWVAPPHRLGTVMVYKRRLADMVQEPPLAERTVMRETLQSLDASEWTSETRRMLENLTLNSAWNDEKGQPLLGIAMIADAESEHPYTYWLSALSRLSQFSGIESAFEYIIEGMRLFAPIRPERFEPQQWFERAHTNLYALCNIKARERDLNAYVDALATLISSDYQERLRCFLRDWVGVMSYERYTTSPYTPSETGRVAHFRFTPEQQVQIYDATLRAMLLLTAELYLSNVPPLGHWATRPVPELLRQSPDVYRIFEMNQDSPRVERWVTALHRNASI